MIIYKITNLINNKSYIGQTRYSLVKRFNEHCAKAGYNSLIKKAILKYGRENFKIEELAKANSLEELNTLECSFIQQNDSLIPKGYNIASSHEPFTSCERTKQHNEKIGKALKNKPKSEDHCKKLSESKIGIRAKNNKWVYGFNSKTNKGIFISSACEAVKLGFNQGHLRECCIGKRNKHKGYTWTYISEWMI